MLRASSLIFFLAACAAAVGACDSGGTDGSTDGATAQSGFPCEVETVLESCTSCHSGDAPSGGVTLLTRDDLMAKSTVDASATIAERAEVRMQDPEFPMPPTGQLAADQIATFTSWVEDGMKGGDCDTVNGGPPATTCTSNIFWTQGDHGSANMHPGVACIACHDKPGTFGAPSLLFGGTVYPSLHEPDDCLGGGASITGATVVVTDANGTEHAATVRSNGNFLIESVFPLKTPARAEIRHNGKVAKMKDDVTNGDCNSCHTVDGANNAPGRLMAP